VQDLSVKGQETAVQVVRLAKVLQDVQNHAMAGGSGPAGNFSLECKNGKLRVSPRTWNGLPVWSVQSRLSGREQ